MHAAPKIVSAFQWRPLRNMYAHMIPGSVSPRQALLRDCYENAWRVQALI